MKSVKFQHIAVLALVALLAMAAGCQLTPLQKASVAADTLTATQIAIEEGGRAGLLTPKQVLDSEPWDFAARAAVAKMFERAEAGDADVWPTEFWHASRAFFEELAKLKALQQQSELAKRLPTRLAPATMPAADPLSPQ